MSVCLWLLRVQPCWGCCPISSQSRSLSRDSVYVCLYFCYNKIVELKQLIEINYCIHHHSVAGKSNYDKMLKLFFFFCVQGYLKHFAYSNTVGNDLWYHLQMVRCFFSCLSNFLFSFYILAAIATCCALLKPHRNTIGVGADVTCRKILKW